MLTVTYPIPRPRNERNPSFYTFAHLVLSEDMQMAPVLASVAYGEVCITSSWLPAAVVAKYRTSTSSSPCNFSRLGRIRCWMSSRLRGACGSVLPDFSISARVPSAGNRFNVSISTAYDLATLKRMFGISSVTSLSKMGMMEFSMMSRVTTGVRVFLSVS